jgi:replicative DNA helicase
VSMNLDRPSLNTIPTTLKELDQWVLWRTIRGTKVPFQRGGAPASSTNPETWASWDEITECEDESDGLGFVFLAGGGLVGIDLDGCRNPETGEVDQWAKEIVMKLGSYAEVSPSRSGIKIFCLGKSPFGAGKKVLMAGTLDAGKQPALELYDRGRYFAVTGWRLGGLAKEPIECDLGWLAERHFNDNKTDSSTSDVRRRGDSHRVSEWYGNDAVLDRARAYLSRVEPAISGQGGHNQTFKATCALVIGFGLDEQPAFQLLSEWNLGCTPPWSERELQHKIRSAAKQEGERNYLRDAKPADWDTIDAAHEPDPFAIQHSNDLASRTTTLVDAARRQIEKMRSGEDLLFDLGIPALDKAIGGGVADGEFVVIAARPSHGKSMVAMQIAHHWTSRGENVLIISEEMSALALGKRALQFISEAPKHEWKYNLDSVQAELDSYAANRGTATVVESCGTIRNVAAQIEKAIKEQQIRAVFVDYLQLLSGGSRQSSNERVSEVSSTLRKLATKHKIRIVALAQLNREVEKRAKWVPQPSDLRDSGQIEQDADVIMCLCWCWKLDPNRDKSDFLIFVAKNRNREILQGVVELKIDADRQMLLKPQASDLPNYDRSFDDFNDRDPVF